VTVGVTVLLLQESIKSIHELQEFFRKDRFALSVHEATIAFEEAPLELDFS
jgi:hypothetical protein